MVDFESTRLSVTLLDIVEGREAEFRSLAREFQDLIKKKGYGHAEIVGDEAVARRFYSVRYWTEAASAERCHADADVRAVTAKIYQIARVSHVVNGARKPDPMRLMLDDRRARIESDRRTGFERRVKNTGRSGLGIAGPTAIAAWGRAGSVNGRRKRIWSEPRDARANTRTPRFRSSRSAPRC